MTVRMRITVVVYEGSRDPLEDPVGRGDSYLRQDALARMRDFVLEASKERTSY
jgi:hypothetical protein